ncbi:MAG: acyl-CoA thioesterase [Anaerolineales bacterium]|nr:acyl-CoA thioesterase [Anaerolineales bacterium]
MIEFKFFHPVAIRYADLGTRQHVNNARYLSFLEDARIAYGKRLGLSVNVGVIIVDIHITYHKPAFLDDQIKVGVRVSYIGNKSLTFEHCIVDLEEKTLYASAETVLVAYDYQDDLTIPVPESWREAIAAFEQG